MRSVTCHIVILGLVDGRSDTQYTVSRNSHTNYTGNGKSFMGVKITPITENRFMISWEEYENTDDSSSENYASADDSLSSSTLSIASVVGKVFYRGCFF